MRWIRKPSFVPWAIFLAWFGLVTATLLTLIATGTLPVDYAVYNDAAAALAEGRSPYVTPEQAREIYRIIHEFMTDGTPPPEDVGNPYLYPPTLASAVEATGQNASAFVIILFVALVGFAALWLHATGVQTAWWLVLCVVSWDVAASLSGGNVEILLLALSLVACWAMSSRGAWIGGIAVALVILVKPFFILLFAGFALLYVRQAVRRAEATRRVAVAALVAVAVIALEVARWPPWLRTETLDYVRNSYALTSLVLPFEEQRPLSDWNRAPVQVLVSAGLRPEGAQAAALVMWALLMGLSLALAPRREDGFALRFALAYVFLLWARPITWTLPFVDFVVLLAVWPWLPSRRWRIVVLFGAILLAASHWAALAFTLTLEMPHLLTLQNASWPLETVTVLPACAFLLLFALLRSALQNERAPLPSEAL